MLQHASTYQALVDDLLDHRLNRVTVDASSKEGIVKFDFKSYWVSAKSPFSSF